MDIAGADSSKTEAKRINTDKIEINKIDSDIIDINKTDINKIDTYKIDNDKTEAIKISNEFNATNILRDNFKSSINNITDIDLNDIQSDKFKLLKKAYDFSQTVHKGQLRESGEPYFTHLIEVASIVASLRMDCASIVAALLHDTVEDTLVTLDQIKEEFGDEIAFIVDGLTKISKLSFKSSEEVQAENIRKMIVAMAKDIRVIIIKLADRLHNLRTLNFLSEERRIKIAQETLDIFAPLANRLGIFSIKSELEDLSLKYLNPAVYKDLSLKISSKKLSREQYIATVADILKANLSEHNFLEAEIYGRPKHFFSIYKKMTEQHISFEEIYDLIALRVIVGTINECYEVLGIVHSLWKPVAGRIKDYIAMPKANMYRSLHTTVIGPEGMRIEIQIRTKEMHFIDEFGIAAHWKYKENITSAGAGGADLQEFNWLRQLVEFQKDVKDPHEFLNSVKIDLFQEDVYVFTPKGDVIALPKDSTPIDFAYYIHTEIGDKTTGAIVNGNIIPLKYKLQNGDIVKILTKEGHHPSKDWLNYAQSSKAISKIRNWIRQQERQESIDAGKESLEKEFRKLGNKKIEYNELTALALNYYSLKDEAELYAGIGFGKYSTKNIFSSVIPGFKNSDGLSLITQKTGNVIQRILQKIKIQPSASSKNVITSPFGGDLLYKIAGCCHPVPGDSIVGYISRGRGVIVHKSDCKNIIGEDETRLITVSWKTAGATSILGYFETKINIVTEDKKGILAEIAAVISDRGANISKAQVRTLKDGRAIHIFDIEVKDITQIDNILNSIKSIKGVIKVNRVTY